MAQQVINDQRFTATRLPKSIKPTHYDLNLKPNLSDGTFTGWVMISYLTDYVAPQKSVVLHANGLKITDGSLEIKSKSSQLKTVTYSPTSETATLEFEDDIEFEGVILLTFEGKINDNMAGFFRTVVNLGSCDVIVGATHFKPNYARRCFPCWDEPAIKATFAVNLTINKFIAINDRQYKCRVLSNMPEQSRQASGSEVEVAFEKTPIMSTYLLAFIVGPFEVLESTDGKRPVRMFTTPIDRERGRFALEVAWRTLLFYELYFEIEYPLPKLDIVALPNYAHHAMENWGLVVCGDTHLLFDPVSDPESRKQYIAIVVARELARQWFGNLVSIEWWTYQWLNESIASFMAYECFEIISQNRSMGASFVRSTYCATLHPDSMHSARPIEVAVERATDIDEHFDSVCYWKGASIIDMLHKYLEPEDFSKGIKDYLTKFAYKSARTEDLWDCLETASYKSVRRLMSGWTTQKGYPGLLVDYTREGKNVRLTITQYKFTANGTAPNDGAESLWIVPVDIITGNNRNELQSICLEGRSCEITLEGVGDSWIKLNAGVAGPYVIAYPKVMCGRLRQAIVAQELPVADVLGLLNEQYVLCMAGKVDTAELLKLLHVCKMETNYDLWRSIDEIVDHLSWLLVEIDFDDEFEAFGRHLYSIMHQRFGLVYQSRELSHEETIVKALVIRRLVALKQEDLIEKALAMYRKQLAGECAVPEGLKDCVYFAAAAHGDEAIFESLFKIYKTTEVSEEKHHVAQALGHAPDCWLLERALEMCLNDGVRKQDKISIIVSASTNSPATTWQFFKDNANFLFDEFGPGNNWKTCVMSASKNFASEEWARDVLKFFQVNKFAGTEKAVERSVEKIRLNALWLNRDKEAIKKCLVELLSAMEYQP